MVVMMPLARLVTVATLTTRGANLDYSGAVVNFLTVFQIDAFAVGAIVALYPRPARPSDTRYLRVAFWIALAVAGCAGFLNLLLLWRSGQSELSGFGLISTLGYPWLMTNNLQYAWGYTILNITAGILILCIINGRSPVPLLKSRFLVYVGKRSYGVYVLHVFVLMVMERFVPIQKFHISGIIWFAVYCGIVLLLAHVSYQLYESRFLALKDSYGKQKSGNVPVVESSSSCNATLFTQFHSHAE